MKKICQNPQCGKTFETESKKKKFCSDNCRVAYARSLAKGDVTTADKLAVPDKAAISFEKLQKQLAWAIPLEKYCNQNNCTPADLIEAHRTRKVSGKSTIPDEETTIKKGTVAVNRNPRSGKLMGVKDGAEVVEMKEEKAPSNESYMAKRFRMKNSPSKS